MIGREMQDHHIGEPEIVGKLAEQVAKRRDATGRRSYGADRNVVAEGGCRVVRDGLVQNETFRLRGVCFPPVLESLK